MRGRPFDVVEQRPQVAGENEPQAFGRGRRLTPGGRHRVEHPIDRPVLTIEQQVVLAVEVVIEVGGRQVGGVGDVAHSGIGEAALAEQPGSRAQDGVALPVTPPRQGSAGPGL